MSWCEFRSPISIWMDIGSSSTRAREAKDRYILFPASFRLVLNSHLRASSQNRYLFETCGYGVSDLSLEQVERAYQAAVRDLNI